MEAFDKGQLTAAIEKLNLLEVSDDKQSTFVATLASLPMEMLWHIFDICDLKDQLSLAKVCKYFGQIVTEILRRKYRYFVYNYIEFRVRFKLEEEEIPEFCHIVGPKVTRLRFVTCMNMEIFCTQLTLDGAPVEKLDYISTGNFRENLKYFPNLLELEIQSTYVCDKTFWEAAKRCQKLTTIRMLHCINNCVEGRYLADLRCIEHLDLKYCHNLDPKHIRAVSSARPLKSLKIVGCKQMENVQKIIKLCKISQHLQTLTLSAFTRDPRFFKAIFSLPLLKYLELLWVDIKPQNFEVNFLAKLKENSQKCLSLKSLKFINDHDFLKSVLYENDSSDDESLIHRYAVEREKVCAYLQPSQWTDEVFEAVSKSMKSFTHLQSIEFNYCRLLSYEQLQQIPKINKNLKVITICGCPREEDSKFHEQWLESEINCQLKFENYLSWEQSLKLQSESVELLPLFYQYPILRCIQCEF